MLSANYTADKICRAIGIDGFSSDRQFLDADESMRLLLTPSFHPEVCVTFVRQGETTSVSAVAARSQVWAQSQPTPQPTATDRAARPLDGKTFDELRVLLLASEDSTPHGFVIVDGMQARTASHIASVVRADLYANVLRRSAYGTFVATAIRAAWNSIDTPRVRNALRDAAIYVDVDLPEEPVPPEKPTFRTMVVGAEEDRHSLLAALGKLRDD